MPRDRERPAERGTARRLLAGLALMALAAAAASCSGDGGEGGGGGADGDGSGSSAAASDQASASDAAIADRIAEGRPYGVETTTEVFVDDSRPVEDPAGLRNAPERSLETDIYMPEGEGPFPLIVHAHGFNGNPGKFTELFTHWAQAGYVVAAPAFPLTNDRAAAATGAPTFLGDYVNQPADVAYVIDQVLRLAESDHPLLGGQVDPERIGVSGHSLGGATAYGLVFHDCCRDDRVDAVVLMSTLPLPFEGGDFRFDGDPGVPTLLLQLTGDPIVPYDAAVQTYQAAGRPKFLVTLEGGGHFEPYEDAPSPFDPVVREATVPFWDAYLIDAPDGPDRVVAAAESADQVRVDAAP